MANLKHANNVKLSIHQADMESHWAKIQCLRQEHTMQLEAKEAFCDVKKNRVLEELQADYQSKPPALYDEQYDLGYWAGYAVGEGAAA